MFCRGSDVLAIQECSSCRVIFTMARFALTLAVVLVAVFLQETQALSFERQPEDDLLDQWLQEQMAEVQSSPDTPVRPHTTHTRTSSMYIRIYMWRSMLVLCGWCVRFCRVDLLVMKTGLGLPLPVTLKNKTT